MSNRFGRSAFRILLVALPFGATAPAAAQSPAKSYLFGEKRFQKACRPPLKYAAGACVRRCPAGYEDLGGYCRFQSMRR
jgi:hypothetical protein